MDLVRKELQPIWQSWILDFADSSKRALWRSKIVQAESFAQVDAWDMTLHCLSVPLNLLVDESSNEETKGSDFGLAFYLCARGVMSVTKDSNTPLAVTLLKLYQISAATPALDRAEAMLSLATVEFKENFTIKFNVCLGLLDWLDDLEGSPESRVDLTEWKAVNAVVYKTIKNFDKAALVAFEGVPSKLVESFVERYIFTCLVASNRVSSALKLLESDEETLSLISHVPSHLLQRWKSEVKPSSPHKVQPSELKTTKLHAFNGVLQRLKVWILSHLARCPAAKQKFVALLVNSSHLWPLAVMLTVLLTLGGSYLVERYARLRNVKAGRSGRPGTGLYDRLANSLKSLLQLATTTTQL